MINVHIRDYDKGDYEFVKSAWLKQQANMIPFKYMKRAEFFERYSELLDDKWNKLEILIACNPELHEQTYGYICFYEDCLHYIYVKGVYRNFGLSSKLLEHGKLKANLTHFSHLADCKHFREITKKHKLTYDLFRFLDL